LIPAWFSIACWRWGSPDFEFDERVSIQILGTATPPAVAASATPGQQSSSPPAIDIDPATTGQGGTAMVRVRGQNLAGLTATLEGKPLPLIQTSGAAVAFVGIAPDHPLGDFPVVVRTPAGQETIAVLTITQTPWPVENIPVSDEQADLITADAAQRELAIRGPIIQTLSTEALWSGVFQRPVAAPISDQFGIARSYNNGPVSSFHSGTDFAAAQGDPVMAAARGKVLYAGPLPVRGNSVIIDHGLGVLSGYHHLSEINVTVGQLVNAGDRIGRVGATGLATGPHLHWEVIVRGVNVDPMLWTQRQFAP
jgi:murein DD-endopeptidase MepM/ murein hydrolase activator NlpD